MWLHGYGDEPESWASDLSSLRTQNAASVKWVFLRAERRPQAYAGGVAIPSWGDWREDAMTKVGSKDYDNEQILAASVRTDLGSILTSIVQVDRVPPTRIIVGGFSMGATVAAEAALQWCSRADASAKLGGLVMLNGWLLLILFKNPYLRVSYSTKSRFHSNTNGVIQVSYLIGLIICDFSFVVETVNLA